MGTRCGSAPANGRATVRDRRPLPDRAGHTRRDVRATAMGTPSGGRRARAAQATPACLAVAVAVVALSALVRVAAADYVHEPRRCMTRGSCGPVSDADPRNLPCVYNGPAQPPQGSGRFLRDLAMLCPDYASLACCDESQFWDLYASLQNARPFMSGCPACWRNFQDLFCSLACSYDQSLFVNVTDSRPYVNGTRALTNMTFWVSTHWGWGWFDSCKDVQYGMQNQPVLSVICQPPNGKPCDSPSQWLSFLGLYANPGSPFPINFIVTPDDPGPVRPLNLTCQRCDSAGAYGCLCTDCTPACRPRNATVERAACTVVLGGYAQDCLSFGCGVAYGIVVIFFVAYLVRRCARAIRHRRALHYSRVDINHSPTDERSDGWMGAQKALRDDATDSAEPAATPPLRRRRGGLCGTGWDSERWLRPIFAAFGGVCARHPWWVLLASGLAVAACSAGVAQFTVVTDPVLLWSAPDSESRIEKNYFDTHFGPFYRTEQIILTPRAPVQLTNFSCLSNMFSVPLFNDTFALEALALQTRIEAIRVEIEESNGTRRNVTLRDICYSPLGAANRNCTIMSPFQYFQNDASLIVENPTCSVTPWQQHFLYCAYSTDSMADPSFDQVPCLGAFGGPVDPNVMLGGFRGNRYSEATAFVITFVVNNYQDARDLVPARAWEAAFIALMRDYHNDLFHVSFSAERSVEDEVDRESESNILTMALSYLVMFLYVSLALGRVSRLRRLCVDSKLTLGLAGVLLVLASVASALGLFAYAGYAATLIIVEVIPFFVLAVGVDNIFILVQSFQMLPRSMPLVDRVAQTMGEVGPSMLLSSVSEAAAFAIGAITTMPAVRVFSCYASVAVFINFLLQISAFVALLVLDARRAEADRYDCAPCLRLAGPAQKRGADRAADAAADAYAGSWLRQLFARYYAPTLMRPGVRATVLLLYATLLFGAVSTAPHVSIGLDQTLALPEDSYLQQYFRDMNAYLHTGAPVYFVVRDWNYGTVADQNAICNSIGCEPDSMLATLNSAARYANETYIALPFSSWLDTYFQWLNPANNYGTTNCCRVFRNGSLCPHTLVSDACFDCLPFNRSVAFPRPENETQFTQYLPLFLTDNPDAACALGGHAAFGQAVDMAQPPQRPHVIASNFRSYHTVMRTSDDYIAGLKSVRAMASEIRASLGIDVFAYAVWYVFYEQYLDIVNVAVVNLSVAMAAVFGITVLLLSSVWAAAIVTAMVASIVVELLGVMALWGISLNAVSLVNLVMATGISVEFCSHILRAFVHARGDRVDRAATALITMGSSVFSGITLTKLGGIIVLALAPSQLFKVYYSHMYAALVVLGAMHGLVVLPVVLSYVGPGPSLAAARTPESEKSPLLSVSDTGDPRGSVNGTARPTSASNGLLYPSLSGLGNGA